MQRSWGGLGPLPHMVSEIPRHWRVPESSVRTHRNASPSRAATDNRYPAFLGRPRRSRGGLKPVASGSGRSPSAALTCAWTAARCGSVSAGQPINRQLDARRVHRVAARSHAIDANGNDVTAVQPAIDRKVDESKIGADEFALVPVDADGSSYSELGLDSELAPPSQVLRPGY